MRISEFPLTLGVIAVLACGAGTAAAFEVKDAPAEKAPAAALPALPSPSAPSLPSIRVDRAIQDMWRDYMSSYRSGDKKAALRQLEGAAQRGDVLAMWKLGRMHADGDGVPRDDFKAFQIFQRIVDLRGDESRESMHAGVVANAFVALGLYWIDGIAGSPVRPNRNQALRVLNNAAAYFGHPDGQYHLARVLLDGNPAPGDARLGVGWLNNAAQKGHVQAQALLGRMMIMGEHMPRNAERGLMWLEVARENASAARERWVIEMHEQAFSAASEAQRNAARQQAERFMRAAERR